MQNGQRMITTELLSQSVERIMSIIQELKEFYDAVYDEVDFHDNPHRPEGRWWEEWGSIDFIWRLVSLML